MANYDYHIEENSIEIYYHYSEKTETIQKVDFEKWLDTTTWLKGEDDGVFGADNEGNPREFPFKWDFTNEDIYDEDSEFELAEAIDDYLTHLNKK